MNRLYLKHRLALSPMAGPLGALRQTARNWKGRRAPELALLRAEDRMIEQVVQRTVEEDSVCVDVGAHIGSMTRMFVAAAPKGKHVVIEAVPEKAQWLRDSFPALEVHHSALSNQEGEVVFYQHLDKPGFSSLSDRSGNTVEIRVPATTLDLVLADRDCVDFIKIDVEGFELEVIEGASQTIARHEPVLLFEAGPVLDPALDNAKYRTLFARLTETHGYVLRPVFADRAGAPPLTLDTFEFCRTYPFLAFNFVARKEPA